MFGLVNLFFGGLLGFEKNPEPSASAAARCIPCVGCAELSLRPPAAQLSLSKHAGLGLKV